MAVNRVTAEVLEVGIQRSDVPGNARVTAEVLEVALIRVAPGGNARLTAEVLEVGIVRTSGVDAVRHGDFFFAN
jgi:hypothetical protein